MHLIEAIIMTRGHVWSSIGVGHSPIVLVNTAPNILNRATTFFFQMTISLSTVTSTGTNGN